MCALRFFADTKMVFPNGTPSLALLFSEGTRKTWSTGFLSPHILPVLFTMTVSGVFSLDSDLIECNS